MQYSFILSLKKNISVIEQLSDRIIVQSPPVKGNIPSYTLDIEQMSPGLLAAIRILAADGATEDYLSDVVLQTDGFSELPKLYYYLQQFMNLGMICHTVRCDGFPLATRVPIYPFQSVQFREVAIDQKYALSRFAYCHKEQNQLILESPLSSAQLILEGWKGAAIIAELSHPQTYQEISQKIPGTSEDAVQLLFSLLLSTQMLDAVDERGQLPEEANDTLVSWEFHDLLFHSRSRKGRHSNASGKTFRFLDQIPQPPMVKPNVSDDIIQL
ncbi:MAG TPA: dehydrogenase, partial [Cyanophyceae cyanobacterium]